MTKQNSGKIRQYRKPLYVNLGIIIFGVIMIYIIIMIFLSFTSKHIVGYEVKTGSLSVSNVYQGIALREETIINSDYSGYINYYSREGERVGFNNMVCTVDESGRLQSMLAEQDMGENSLTDDNLMELRNQITGFVNNFEANHFQSVYDFKYSVQGTVLKLANIGILENLDTFMNQTNSELINLCRAPMSGIIAYNIDGYEDYTPEMISEADFNNPEYQKTQLITEEMVTAGAPIYKLSTDENWKVIIPMDQRRAEELLKEEYVKVKFLKNQYSSWGKVSVLNNPDGNTYVQLDFNNSMISFCTDRFIDLELVTNEQQGLKVPNTAIVEKEFYLVPVEYVTKGGDSNEDGVLREKPAEDGSLTAEFVPATIYNRTEEEYYLDGSVLRIGDYLVKPDSTDKFPVSKRGTLIGVYNINKGYADFKQIQILYDNEEYSIIKSNTDYGLSDYDHIVLDASTVNEDEFIYE